MDVGERWGVKIGSQVDIKRSDGRVHPAVVSGFNEASESLTVEWFENQETKGKELDLRHVAALNPAVALAIKRQNEPPAKAAKKVDSAPAKPAVKEPVRRPTNKVQSKLPKKNAAPAPAAPKATGASKDRAANKIQDIANKREARRANQEVIKRKVDGEKAARSDNANWEFGRMVAEYRDATPMIKGIPPGTVPVDRKITCCVRKRPMNRREKERSDVDVTSIPDGEHTLIHECKKKVDLTKFVEHHQFRFDHAFDETVDNTTVYKYTAAPLVNTIFDKGMATCFAYGQTGSGKTHTMGGEFGEGSNTPDSTAGIYAMAAADVFRHNSLPVNAAKNLTVSVSFFEIYAGKVFDLLNNQKRLRVLEDGKQNVNVVGLTEEVVEDIGDVLSLLAAGVQLRASGTTSANENSSRSHAILQIILRNPKRRLHGKFSLIDLAGNERGADTAKADRQTRMEGAEINKSLLALKECIRALSMKSKHTPYRASKLTQVLRDSFVGNNSRTCMISMISPGLASCEHTLNTLRYADRVKELKSKKGDKAKAPKALSNTALNNRVGELAAAGNAGAQEDSASDVDLEAEDEGDWLGEPSPLETSLARQDLSKLHKSLAKAKGGKSSAQDAAVMDFHDAVADLMEEEEKLVEAHRNAIECSREELGKEAALLNKMESVDNDVEEYARELDQMLEAKIARLTALRANVQGFRKKLLVEETASKQIQGGMRFAE